MFPQGLQPAVNLPHRRPVMGIGTIPQAPRVMVQGVYPALGSLLEQIQEDEAKKLYPRLVLFEALAVFKDKRRSRQRSDNPICEARRDFLDSYAYLCDVEKGGKTVTATALQSLPNSDFLWLAANEGVREDIWLYAMDVLQLLKTTTSENQGAVKDSVFKLAVGKCKPRIQYYRDQVQKHARTCRMALRSREKDNVVILLRTKLKKLSEPPPSLTVESYVDICHDMRIAELNHITRCSTATTDEFAKLAHYIWRLGATRSAAIKVVDAMIMIPSLHRISQIRRVIAPEVVEKTIHSSCISPQEVLYGVIADSTTTNPLQCEHAFKRLFELDPPVARPIKNKMAAREKITTRVHAELQIADTYSRSRELEFVDNDKYIGCSKPACYFCYLWLCNHKHYYVHPATHYKIIPGCRGQDNKLNETGANVLIEMYSKMSREIGQDIFQFLHQNANPRSQYMSTEASTRASSQISATREE